MEKRYGDWQSNMIYLDFVAWFDVWSPDGFAGFRMFMFVPTCGKN